MTVTDFEKTTGAQEFTLRDEQGPILLYGEIIADTSWNYDTAFERGHVRWTDITLYRNCTPGAQYRYVIQVVGRSVVYHRPNGRCHKGIAVPVSRLRLDEERYQNLAVCQICTPPDLEDMQDTDIVNAEEDLFTLHKCENADAVVKTMQNRVSRGSVSWLNVKLLQVAERGDADIAAALRQTRRL